MMMILWIYFFAISSPRGHFFSMKIVTIAGLIEGSISSRRSDIGYSRAGKGLVHAEPIPMQRKNTALQIAALQSAGKTYRRRGRGLSWSGAVGWSSSGGVGVVGHDRRDETTVLLEEEVKCAEQRGQCPLSAVRWSAAAEGRGDVFGRGRASNELHPSGSKTSAAAVPTRRR